MAAGCVTAGSVIDGAVGMVISGVVIVNGVGSGVDTVTGSGCFGLRIRKNSATASSAIRPRMTGIRDFPDVRTGPDAGGITEDGLPAGGITDDGLSPVG